MCFPWNPQLGANNRPQGNVLDPNIDILMGHLSFFVCGRNVYFHREEKKRVNRLEILFFEVGGMCLTLLYINGLYFMLDSKSYFVKDC